MPDGDVTPSDPVMTNVSQEYVNEEGNTVIIGFPPSVDIGYTGTPIVGDTGGHIDEMPTEEPQ